MLDEYFYYILVSDSVAGSPRHATPFKTQMNYLEFEDWVKTRTEKIHPKGKDTVFVMGAMEFVNPVVMMVDDFKNHCPYIIEKV